MCSWVGYYSGLLGFSSAGHLLRDSKYSKSAHRRARKLGNSCSLIDWGLMLGAVTPWHFWPVCDQEFSCSQGPSSGRGMQGLEVGSHRWEGLHMEDAGDLRLGWRELHGAPRVSTPDTVHLEKEDIFGKWIYTEWGRGWGMGEKIRRCGKSV